MRPIRSWAGALVGVALLFWSSAGSARVVVDPAGRSVEVPDRIERVATVGAALTSNPREKVSNQPLSFFLVVGGRDPLKASVAQTKEKLSKSRYPVIYEEVPNMGHEYIDGKAGVSTLEKLVRWIDSLDHI